LSLLWPLNTRRHDQFKKGRQLSLSLEKTADKQLSDHSFDDALTSLSKALIAEPGRASLIHKLGKCLEAMGEGEDALACYRSTVPDKLNRRFFNSDELSSLIKDAVDCDQVAVLSSHEYESIELQSPARNDTQKRYDQFSYTKTVARSTFCTVASQGAIWFDGFNTIAFDCSGNIVSDHLRGNEFACYPSTQQEPAFEIEGRVCFLDGRSSPIYYHWMLDILPKIGVMQKAGVELDDIDYFIVNAKSGFQKESLRLLGTILQSNRIGYTLSLQLPG